MMIYQRILIIIFFTFLASTVHSQTPYSNYIDSTSTWYSLHRSIEPDTQYYKFLTYYIDGDTVIGGKSYFILYSLTRDSIVHLNPSAPTVDTTYSPILQSFIREDSLKRVYEIGWFPEHLVYDFSLALYDTFPGLPFGTVSAIDTIYFGTTPLKRFKCTANAVIEGIGSTHWLVCGRQFFNMIGDLICYEKQSVLFNYDAQYNLIPAYISCNSFAQPVRHPTSISEKDNDYFNLFPNPTDEKLMVEVTPNDIGTNVVVVNNIGRQVMIFTLNQTSTEVNIKSLEPGIYFILLSNYNKTWGLKFVKK